MNSNEYILDRIYEKAILKRLKTLEKVLRDLQTNNDVSAKNIQNLLNS
ncbi:MAG: hypothetical protein LBJ32_01425 [Oscillospiraceae bacterium]|nr:hypothetical protein [Oscillospiraceae bacterium]